MASGIKKRHVLVVDDNAEIRALIVTTLGDKFYQLGQAANGQQALEYLSVNDLPELIILDLAMPGMSGLEVLQRIKNDPDTTHIAIIVLSANAHQQSDEAISHGAHEVFQKPFGPLQLLMKVESILG